MACSRPGSSLITRLRSASLYEVHDSISRKLRPQPWQSPDPRSTMQIFSQGERIGAMTGINVTRPP
jgi:hypothetical protein